MCNARNYIRVYVDLITPRRIYNKHNMCSTKAAEYDWGKFPDVLHLKKK